MIPEKLLIEWHPVKNKGLLLENLTPKSYEYVWWKCSKGHEWGMTVRSRFINNQDCPECERLRRIQEKKSKKAEKEQQSLAEADPELALQWHPTKNSEYNIENVKVSDKQSFWWRCQKGHEWKDSVKNRHNNSERVCIYCSDKVLHNGNSLAERNPKLAKEWFLFENEKNLDNITPYDVIYNSKYQATWVCTKGHLWKESVNKRVENKSECPICERLKTSLAVLDPELAKEWDVTKNKLITNHTPFDIQVTSNESVWWICSKCNYEYKFRIRDRYKGNGKCKNCYPDPIKTSKKKKLARTFRDFEDERIIFESSLKNNIETK